MQKLHDISCPPLHPPAEKGEVPITYLARLAHLNGYGSVGWLLRPDKSYWSNTFNHSRLYASLKKYPWSGFDAEADSVVSLYDLPKEKLCSQSIRYCPECLKESPIFKIHWQLKVSVVCSRHRVLLHDSCPKCESTLKPGSLFGTKCKCGYDLQDAPSKNAGRALSALQTLMEDGTVQLNCFRLSPLSDFSSMDVQKRCELVYFFCRWIRLSQAENTSRAHYSFLNQIDTALPYVREVALILFGRPEHLSGFFCRLNEQSYWCGVYEKILLQRFYKEFLHEYRSICSISHLLEQYVARNIERTFDKRNSLFRSVAHQKHRWMSIPQVLKSYPNIARSQLMRSIQSKEVASSKLRSCCREITLVERDDVHTLSDRLSQTMTLKAAAEYLGVTKGQFRRLAAQRIIVVPRSKQPGETTNWEVSKRSLDYFLYRLEPIHAEANVTILPFAELAQGYGRFIPDVFCTLLNAVSSKQIPCFRLSGGGAGLGSIGLRKEDFDAWRDEQPSSTPGAWMSIPDLASSLHISQEFVYQLVNNGYLKTQKLEGCSTRWISPEHLKQFQSRYVLLSRLAKLLDLLPCHAAHFLELREIYPVDHGKPVQLKHKLYDRFDLLLARSYLSLVTSNEDWR